MCIDPRTIPGSRQNRSFPATRQVIRLADAAVDGAALLGVIAFTVTISFALRGHVLVLLTVFPALTLLGAALGVAHAWWTNRKVQRRPQEPKLFLASRTLDRRQPA